MDTPALAVNHKSVGLTAIFVGSQPDRQQYMLKGDVRQLSVDLRNALAVSANVKAHVALDHAIHMGLGLAKPLFQVNRIGLGAETGKELGLIGG